MSRLKHLLASFFFASFAQAATYLESPPLLLSEETLYFSKRSWDGMLSPSPYQQNSRVSNEIWSSLQPYFVPEYSHEKAALDTIFHKPGVLQSMKSLSEAGFLLITNPKSKIIVLSHPYLKGYLIKVYLETEPMAEWDAWLRRVRGAHTIQEAIISHGYQHLMKVPKKWIYPLPENSLPVKDGMYRKNFVLLVEEMDILEEKKNRKAFKNKITHEHLVALYTLLTKYRLIDSVYSDNIPFCKDGKIAFIDTEWAGDTTIEVPLSSIGQYLSKPMLAEWEQLLNHGVH